LVLRALLPTNAATKPADDALSSCRPTAAAPCPCVTDRGGATSWIALPGSTEKEIAAGPWAGARWKAAEPSGGTRVLILGAARRSSAGWSPSWRWSTRSPPHRRNSAPTHSDQTVRSRQDYMALKSFSQNILLKLQKVFFLKKKRRQRELIIHNFTKHMKKRRICKRVPKALPWISSHTPAKYMLRLH
jgi:hypothetical protein